MPGLIVACFATAPMVLALTPPSEGWSSAEGQIVCEWHLQIWLRFKTHHAQGGMMIPTHQQCRDIMPGHHCSTQVCCSRRSRDHYCGLGPLNYQRKGEYQIHCAYFTTNTTFYIQSVFLHIEKRVRVCLYMIY